MIQSGDLSDAPNPFAIDLASKTRDTSRVRAAVKGLLVVAAVFAVVLVIGSESRRWLLGRLTEDFDALEPAHKRQRLAQIAELDELAVPHLVATLNDGDVGVARTAYRLTSRLQSQWTKLDTKARLRRHRLLITELDEVALQLPDDRTGWASELLQNTLAATDDGEDERHRELYRLTQDALTSIALTNRPGPSVLEQQPSNSRAPVRVARRGRTVPVEQLPAETWDWVDGSPPERESLKSSPHRKIDEGADGFRDLETTRAVVDGQNATTIAPQSIDAAIATGSDAVRAPANPPQSQPSIYRSAAIRLRRVPPGQDVQLREIERSRAQRWPTSVPAGTTAVVDSPLQTYDDRSVFHWLTSDDPMLRDQARAELARRSYSADEVAVAIQVASKDPRIRMAVLDSISRSTQLDPRPWLLMLVEDPDAEVRSRAISALATLDDPTIRESLRRRLASEPDAVVAAEIRRVIDRR